MDIFYKITNTSTEIVSWPWVKGLLSPQERIDYEDYKLTSEYLGVNEADKQSRRHVPEYTKALPFFDRLEKGVEFEDQYTHNGVTRMEKRLKWCLGPNYDKIRERDGAIYICRDICQRYKIKFESKDSVEELLQKIEKKFGSFVTVLSKIQYSSSGMEQALGIKQIIQKSSKYDPKEIMLSGFLEAVEITPEEAAELLGDSMPEEVTSSRDLDKLDYKSLQAMATAKGIKGVVGKTKKDLIQLLAE